MRKSAIRPWPDRVCSPTIATPAGKSAADLYQLAIAKADAKDAHILKLLAAYGIVNEVGWPGFKSLWASPPRSLARLKKELGGLDLASSVAVAGFAHIERSLKRFEPLTMEALTA